MDDPGGMGPGETIGDLDAVTERLIEPQALAADKVFEYRGEIVTVEEVKGAVQVIVRITVEIEGGERSVFLHATKPDGVLIRLGLLQKLAGTVAALS